MRRRIYGNFLILILPAILLLSALLSLFFFDVSQTREMGAVRDNAGLIADFLNQGFHGELPDFISGDTPRITIIAPDGMVLLDNLADADALENHIDRTEVLDAFRIGRGEATRYSHTLRTDTYYYALRLSDGNVLRLSKTVGSIASAFTESLPIVFMVTALLLLLANFLARRLTKHIVYPLGNIDFDGENTVVYDELLPYAKKIAEQKREIAGQIEALENRADTIAAITENMKEGLILLDQNGTVLTANKSAQNMFGDMTRKSVLHVCRDIAFGHGVKQCLSGVNGEIVFKHSGKIYNVYFSPVHSDIHGAVILFFDVTARYEAEAQRREFSANVSHELKTPLTSISALSEMIETGMAKEEDIKGFAARISEQTKRLINIIEDIIKLSEFDEGKAGQTHETFDLYTLIEDAADALRKNDRGVSIRLTGERFNISANRRMIDEMLYNLLDNGVKYNTDGGSVTVALSREDGFCKIVVSDTGIGIPPGHQRRVFERFYRVDSSRSKKTGGTGLGLSIVKHIAAHHGGNVELESVDGAGTTVVCRIAMETKLFEGPANL